jgi:hypothetical protein
VLVILSCFDVFPHIFLFFYILFSNYIYIQYIILYIYDSIIIPSISLLCIHYTSHSLILVGYTRMVSLHLCMHQVVVILKLSNYFSIEALTLKPRMMWVLHTYIYSCSSWWSIVYIVVIVNRIILYIWMISTFLYHTIVIVVSVTYFISYILLLCMTSDSYATYSFYLYYFNMRIPLSL